MKSKLTLILLLVIFFAGCKKENSTEDNTTPTNNNTTDTKPKLVFEKKVGRSGLALGEFDMGFSIHTGAFAIDSNYLYVTDRVNNRIQKFTMDLTPVAWLGSYNGTFGFHTEAAKGEDTFTPKSIYCVNGFIYVTIEFGDEIKKISLQTGNIVHSYAFANYKTAIAVDNNYNLYAYNYESRAITKYNVNGDSISTIGSYGSDPGKFSSLSVSLAVDKDNNLYAHDPLNQMVNKFAPNGSLTLHWNMTAWYTNTPINFDLYNDKIYMLENSYFTEYDLGGNLIKKWDTSDAGLGGHQIKVLNGKVLFQNILENNIGVSVLKN